MVTFAVLKTDPTALFFPRSISTRVPVPTGPLPGQARRAASVLCDAPGTPRPSAAPPGDQRGELVVWPRGPRERSSFRGTPHRETGKCHGNRYRPVPAAVVLELLPVSVSEAPP